MFSPDGQPLAQWSFEGNGDGQPLWPTAVAVESDGDMYVADRYSHRIHKLSPSGEPLGQWAVDGTAPGQFKSPAGIAVDRQGDVYVADAANAGSRTSPWWMESEPGLRRTRVGEGGPRCTSRQTTRKRTGGELAGGPWEERHEVVGSRPSSLALAALLLALAAWAPTVSAGSEPAAWESLGPGEATVRELLHPGERRSTCHQRERPPPERRRRTNLADHPTPGPDRSRHGLRPVNHDHLYAAGEGGVYRSQDGGGNWERVSPTRRAAGDGSRSAPADPDVLYGDASTMSDDRYGTIIRYERRVSHDPGATWEVTHTSEERRASGSPYVCGHLSGVSAPCHEQRQRLLTVEGCTSRDDPFSYVSYDEGRTSSYFPEIDRFSWPPARPLAAKGSIQPAGTPSHIAATCSTTESAIPGSCGQTTTAPPGSRSSRRTPGAVQGHGDPGRLRRQARVRPTPPG